MNCCNILTIRIDIIEFHVNVISGLDFSIILYLYLFHKFFENEYQGFYFEFFSMKIKLIFLSQYQFFQLKIQKEYILKNLERIEFLALRRIKRNLFLNLKYQDLAIGFFSSLQIFRN